MQIFLSFLFGTIGGWMVHVLIKRSDKGRIASLKTGCTTANTATIPKTPFAKSPEWEEIRKIPGLVSLTMAVPVLFIAASPVGFGEDDLILLLLFTCLVLYGLISAGFNLAGAFYSWGPDGSVLARKRMVNAANLYVKAKFREISPKESISLQISQRISGPDGVKTLGIFENHLPIGHSLQYGPTGKGMTDERNDIIRVTSDEKPLVDSMLAHLRYGSRPVILGMSDINQLRSLYSENSPDLLENAKIKLHIDETKEDPGAAKRERIFSEWEEIVSENEIRIKEMGLTNNEIADIKKAISIKGSAVLAELRRNYEEKSEKNTEIENTNCANSVEKEATKAGKKKTELIFSVTEEEARIVKTMLSIMRSDVCNGQTDTAMPSKP